MSWGHTSTKTQLHCSQWFLIMELTGIVSGSQQVSLWQVFAGAAVTKSGQCNEKMETGLPASTVLICNLLTVRRVLMSRSQILDLMQKVVGHVNDSWLPMLPGTKEIVYL